jgi:hypothetical protein
VADVFEFVEWLAATRENHGMTQPDLAAGRKRPRSFAGRFESASRARQGLSARRLTSDPAGGAGGGYWEISDNEFLYGES